MKRILYLFTVIVLTLAMSPSVQAQTTPHFKFMGIPINGTITSFQSKLEAKGFTYNAKDSKSAGPGIRHYNGKFSGYKARLVVFYNSGTKIVYDVKVIIDRYSRDASESLYRELRSNLISKYDGKCEYESSKTDDGFDDTTFYIYHDDKTVGVIYLYIQEPTYSDSWVAVEYIDIQNYEKNKDANLKDL